MNSEPYKSEKGEIPLVNTNHCDLITSLVSRYESNDLHTSSAVNFRYDESNEYVYMDFHSIHNGQKVVPEIMYGYHKNKVITMCENILKYFKENEKGDNDE